MGVASEPAPTTRRRRRIAVALLAVAVAAGTAFTADRVFGATEIVTDATGGYPAAAPVARPGVIGTLAAAPLIVDGRLRVYATKRQVRADAPVDARTQRTPFWSYRRWPAQVVGVVAVGTTVVGRWSDGLLVAIDARTGRVAWRAAGPTPERAEYTGRRTGASTVYAPDGLYTAGQVVIVRGAIQAVAVRTGDGRELWRRTTPGRECRAGEFTTTGRYLLVTGCGAEKSIITYDATSGRPVALWPPSADVREAAPLGCRLGRSDCAGVRITDSGGTQGWLLHDQRPVAAPALALKDVWLVGGLAIAPASGGVVASRSDSGTQAWIWRGGADVIAVQPGRVHLLTEDHWLVTVDAATGDERSRFLFTYGRERTGWTAGLAYARGSFLLVERLAADPDPLADDDSYYFIAQPVLLAGT
jgi:hypothetical protein